MNISKIISIAQIVVSIALIIVVLLQKGGSDAGGAFGGSGASYFAKRGAEKGLFIITVILSIIYAGLAVAVLVIK